VRPWKPFALTATRSVHNYGLVQFYRQGINPSWQGGTVKAIRFSWSLAYCMSHWRSLVLLLRPLHAL